MSDLRILLIGERLGARTFPGANKALPVLASSLVNSGFSNVVQFDFEDPNNTESLLVHQELPVADLIFFAGVMTPQLAQLDLRIQLVHQALQGFGRSHVPIFVGGYVTKGIEDVARISPHVTAFCDGEGEEMAVEIARSVATGRFEHDREAIRGLIYIDNSGKLRHSRRPRVRNFDSIDQNFGLSHLPGVYDMEIFSRPDGSPRKTAQLFTQRGCPFVCGYCNKSLETNKVVRLSEDSLRRQLRELREQGYEAVYLDVDTFTVDSRAALREARIIAEEGFVWGSNTRIDMVNLEDLKFFVDHGCVYLFFGVEHTDPGVGVAIHKFHGPLPKQYLLAKRYLDRVKQVFQAMRRVGLPSSYFIILGLPKAELDSTGMRVIGYRPTTFEEDWAAIEFGLRECMPDFLNFNVLRFMPGSAAADVPNHATFQCVRPSGEQPITAGYFLPRAIEFYGYPKQDNHPVFRLCESVSLYQPRTTAVDPERIYRTFERSIEWINRRIKFGGNATTIFFDKEIIELGLVQRLRDNRYVLAPLKDFDQLDEEGDYLLTPRSFENGGSGGANVGG